MTKHAEADDGLPSGAARGKGRPKGVADRELAARIVAITCDVFLAHGYRGVKMARIAEAAHVSLSTVYRLFPNKIALFAAMIDEHRQSMVALPGRYDDLPVAEALERIFRVDLDEEAEHWRAALVERVIADMQQHPELHTVFIDSGPEHSHRLVAEWLAAQAAAGRIVVSDAGVAARMLMDVAFGPAARQSSGGPGWRSAAERTAYLRACFGMIAAGLVPRPEPGPSL